ncbi:5-methylcytosine restriction system specificity protein McrC [Salinimicrobium sp. WS361]|uniref:5-methylcytosine restriction system specificity protein McrC n=1 Tax=Salinimicrobium sp. WS361 TaxID=3425123 RepID=UPI003D6DB6C6
MESKFLTEILASGDIVDNQEYLASGHILRNHRLGEIELKEPYRVNNAEFYRRAFEFLGRDVVKVNEKIKRNKDEIFLFGSKDYEHNSDDPFINFTGFNRGNFKIKTGNIIGEIKVNGYNLKIGSRFGDNFLRYIISDAEGFLEIENSGGINKKSSYDWLIYHLWLTKLKKAFRLGIPKNYIKKEENLTYIRGSVDVIKYYQNKNSAILTCNYSSLSRENPATNLIATVFKRNEKNSIFKNQIRLRSAFYIASGGNFVKPHDIDRINPFSNPYYHSYNEVISLSKLILKRKSLEFGDKSEESAFLFDVSMLFEYFVKRLFRRSGLNVLDKFSNAKRITKGFNKKHELQPDIVLEEEGKFAIFDVKYKSFDPRYGVKREDLFQLHTYVGQYSNYGKVTSAGFVYPMSQKNFEKLNLGKSVNSEKLSVGGKILDFYILFVVVPDADNFSEFSSLFHSNNEIFQNTITKIMD